MTPPMSDLQALLDRVVAATSWDVDLDNAIGCYFSEPGGPFNTKPAFLINPRPYTQSLDAALALVERVLPGWDFHIEVERSTDGPTIWRTEMGDPLIGAALEALIEEGHNG